MAKLQFPKDPPPRVYISWALAMGMSWIGFAVLISLAFNA